MRTTQTCAHYHDLNLVYLLTYYHGGNAHDGDQNFAHDDDSSHDLKQIHSERLSK